MSPDDFRRLVALGMNTEQIAAVMEMMDRESSALKSTQEDGKEKARIRWRRWRENHPANANQRWQTFANVSKRLARVEDNLLTLEIEPQESKKEKIEAQRSPRSELEVILDPLRAGAVIDHRQRLRKPLTAHAAKLLAGKLARCSDPNAAADTMISNGWQGFEPVWLKGPPPRGSPKPKLADRFKAFGDFLDERQNEIGDSGAQQIVQHLPAITGK